MTDRRFGEGRRQGRMYIGEDAASDEASRRRQGRVVRYGARDSGQGQRVRGAMHEVDRSGK